MSQEFLQSLFAQNFQQGHVAQRQYAEPSLASF